MHIFVSLPLLFPFSWGSGPFNRLEELVENGADPQPGTKGANYIITNDGERVDLSQFNSASYTLELGYKATFPNLSEWLPISFLVLCFCY